VAFSPDGKRLTSSSGFGPPHIPGKVKVWDAQTGKELLAGDGTVTSYDATPLTEKP
jgi:hypothetical protein